MQFTLSRGSYTSKKAAVFARCCHLPSPSQSACSPLHPSFTILLPSAFSWSPFPSFHHRWASLSTTPLLLGSAPFHLTLPLPLASSLCSCIPQAFSSASPEVYRMPFLSHLLYAWISLLRERVGLEPQASDPSPPCSSRSLCSALRVGGGGGRANPSAGGPRLPSGCPRSLGKTSAIAAAVIVQGSLSRSSSAGWEGQVQLCSAPSCSSSKAARLQPPLGLFLQERAKSWEGKKLFAQTVPGKWHHDFEESLKRSKTMWCWVWFLLFKPFTR